MLLRCVLFLIFLSTVVAQEWCNSDKCTCEDFTDKDTNLPVRIANCAAINLNTFPDQSKLSDNINILDLSFNNIKELDQFNYKFESVVLKKLLIAHNQIARINAQFFLGLPNLHVLDLSYNNISGIDSESVFSKQRSLRKLFLQFNNIAELPGGLFSHFPHLRQLDLSNNPIGTFLMKMPNTLSEILDISVNLTHLTLDNVGLEQVPASFFSKFVNLKYVSLAGNQFVHVPTLPDNSLEYLDMSRNKLTSLTLHFLKYKSLKVLKLNGMDSLVHIDDYAFYGLISLDRLILTDCPNLRGFNKTVFDILARTNVVNPKSLILTRNGIETLHKNYSYLFNNMNHVDLSFNQWHCDCNILWLQEFSHILVRNDEMRCASPKNLINVKLMDLHDSDLPQCYPHVYGLRSHRLLMVVMIVFIILLVAFIAYLLKYRYLMPPPNEILVGPQSPYRQMDDVSS